MKRFSGSEPCPVCSGFDGAPRGQGVRCFGFVSDDGAWAHCTREEFAGGLTINTASNTYAHRMRGPCECGRTHGNSANASGGITRRYEIKSAAGVTVAVHVRQNPPGEDKRMWWELPDGSKGLGGLKRDSLPLYGVEKLRDLTGPVVMVEGEKAADSLNAAGILAVGTITGAGGTPSDESLKPLSGRPVYVWPDHDDEGRAHMNRIAAGLDRNGATPHMIAWPGASEKGDDAADFFDRGGKAEGVRELMLAAKLWTPSTADGDSAAVLIRLSDVKAEKVAWLWPGRIPLGKLSILDGDPGLGKSLITIDLAARITKNISMPDGTVSDLDGPEGVVILSAEDGRADTIRPRFDVAGGDAFRVVLLEAVREADDDGKPARERSVTLADLPALTQAIRKVGARLVVVDPYMAYTGKIDAHVDSENRGLLAPLARLASETGAAILLIRHLRKTGGANPLYAGGGSIGIIGAVRSGMIVAPDPDDESGENYIFAHTKSNLSRPPSSLTYKILEVNGVPVVEWGGESAHDARSLLAAQGEDTDERDERSTLNQAVVFLRNLLKSSPVPVKEVHAAARAECITPATLRRARSELGVESFKSDFDAGWVWSLPLQGAQDAQNDGNEHLRAPSAHSAIKRNLREDAHPETLSTFGAETATGKVEINEDIPF